MKRISQALSALLLSGATTLAWAGPGAVEATQKQPLNMTAISMFFVFVLATMGITWWAA